MNSIRNLAILVTLTLGVAACEDPAADKPKAAVGSAKPVPSAAASVAKSAAAPAASASAAPAEKPKALDIPEKPAGAVDIDPASTVGFTGSKVTGKHDGKFEKFSGWIELKDGKLEGGRVAVKIEMGTVKTDDAKLDGHLQTGDFFLVEEHPIGTFVSTDIKTGGEKGATHTIEGNLNMRGVEKSVTFPAKIDVTKDPMTATAEFSINRKDWGIVYTGKADDLIRDDVVIKLDLKAAKAK